MKYIFCVNCGKKVKAKRVDKKYCKVCLSLRLIFLRRRRDKLTKAKERYKRYRATTAYKTKARLRYYKKTKDQRMAQYYVTNAVRDGRLKRPKFCENCGTEDWGIKRSMIEAHHYLGYAIENWLKVKWLCTTCHKIADRKGVVAGEY